MHLALEIWDSAKFGEGQPMVTTGHVSRGPYESMYDPVKYSNEPNLRTTSHLDFFSLSSHLYLNEHTYQRRYSENAGLLVNNEQHKMSEKLSQLPSLKTRTSVKTLLISKLQFF